MISSSFCQDLSFQETKNLLDNKVSNQEEVVTEAEVASEEEEVSLIEAEVDLQEEVVIVVDLEADLLQEEEIAAASEEGSVDVVNEKNR